MMPFASPRASDAEELSLLGVEYLGLSGNNRGTFLADTTPRAIHDLAQQGFRMLDIKPQHILLRFRPPARCSAGATISPPTRCWTMNYSNALVNPLPQRNHAPFTLEPL